MDESKRRNLRIGDFVFFICAFLWCVICLRCFSFFLDFSAWYTPHGKRVMREIQYIFVHRHTFWGRGARSTPTTAFRTATADAQGQFSGWFFQFNLNPIQPAFLGSALLNVSKLHDDFIVGRGSTRTDLELNLGPAFIRVVRLNQTSLDQIELDAV